MRRLEEDAQQYVADRYALITGTSSSGIIAIGLGLGIPASEILRFYATEGPAIFPGTSPIQRVGGLIRQLFGPKHSHAVLREKLSAIFGEHRLGESKCRLVIPAYDAVAGRIFPLKTGHHPRCKYEVDVPAVDVALATSAAPTYFAAAPFPTHEDVSYVDGGVWANSRVLVGLVRLVEAVSFPTYHRARSICSASRPPLFRSALRSTRSRESRNRTRGDRSYVRDTAEAALAQARLMLGGRLHRIDYKAKSGEFSLDNARPEKIPQLISLGQGEAVENENPVIVQTRFLNDTPADPFEPIVPVGK